MNAVCNAAIYHRIGFDAPSDKKMREARCFMRRQLGWLTNHKCKRKGEACNTHTPEGFSYLVGCALPVHAALHRDLRLPPARGLCDHGP